eukprot:jgi/Phyca11/510032/fgenesh2_kg.PHYCAscaffold_53_\
MVASESIDQDDLHPYNSSEYVRRDVSAAVLLSEEKSGDEEVGVVLRGIFFMKIYKPNFDVPEQTLTDVQERTAQWPNVMLRSVREMIETPKESTIFN